MSTFISCDWGTSAFRLRLLEGREVIASLFTGEGIAPTHAAWQTSGRPAGEREAFYREVLEKAIGELAGSASVSRMGGTTAVNCPAETTAANGESGTTVSDLGQVPVVISGMASSSIGMLELPYRSLPFDVSGADLQPAILAPTAASPRTLYLLSGVRSPDDVMRGEETQLIGCGSNGPGERVFVFPGTHSKHIIVRNARAVDFKTYMTGELFNLLARQSILAGSVAPPDAASIAAPDIAASGPGGGSSNAALPPSFYAGVAAARGSGLLHNAFLARTNHLFGKYGKEDNYHFLSGLLIGEELMELVDHPHDMGAAVPPSRPLRPVTLAASSPLREAYAGALAQLGVGQPTVIDADQALIAGHCAMMARFGATIALNKEQKA